jgi:V8-like Glu-specific endopeptidase
VIQQVLRLTTRAARLFGVNAIQEQVRALDRRGDMLDLTPPDELFDVLRSPLAALGFGLDFVHRNDLAGGRRPLATVTSPDWQALLLYLSPSLLQESSSENIHSLTGLAALFEPQEHVYLLSTPAQMPVGFFSATDWMTQAQGVDFRYVSAKSVIDVAREPERRQAAIVRSMLGLPDTRVMRRLQSGEPESAAGSEAQSPRDPAAPDLPRAAVERVTAILERRAKLRGDARKYFGELLDRSQLGRSWAQTGGSPLTGDADADARRVVSWAGNRGPHPSDARYTTLGSLLFAALKDASVEEAADLLAVIQVHRLSRDARIVESLGVVPQLPSSSAPGVAADFFDDFLIEPEIGSELDPELQGLFQPDVQTWDVGFVSRAVAHSAAVCRVETVEGKTLGTGFLVARTCVLTCHHVLPRRDGREEIEPAQVVLRFGCLTGPSGEEGRGILVRLATDTPVLTTSPVNELDFALLQIEVYENSLLKAEPLRGTDGRLPARGDAIHMLHHPGGATMKLTLSPDGVSRVYADQSVLQYVSKTGGGSSGSPCFDDSWALIGVHRAERGTLYGALREGILFRSIREQIRTWL